MGFVLRPHPLKKWAKQCAGCFFVVKGKRLSCLYGVSPNTCCNFLMIFGWKIFEKSNINNTYISSDMSNIITNQFSIKDLRQSVCPTSRYPVFSSYSKNTIESRVLIVLRIMPKKWTIMLIHFGKIGKLSIMSPLNSYLDGSGLG